jgi:hypothetical protein
MCVSDVKNNRQYRNKEKVLENLISTLMSSTKGEKKNKEIGIIGPSNYCALHVTTA